MKKIFTLFALLALITASVHAAPTTAQLRGGIVINEVLLDATVGAGPAGVDTDGDGAAEDGDEYIELYNQSAGTIALDGLEIWDSGSGNLVFTFPAATNLGAGNFAVVVSLVGGTGSVAALNTGGNLAFDAAAPFAPWSNTQENFFVYDPTADEFIEVFVNGGVGGAGAIDLALDTDFSAANGSTATRVGSAEDWGSDIDGEAIGRSPDGDTTFGTFSALGDGTVAGTPGSANPVGAGDPYTDVTDLASLRGLADGTLVRINSTMVLSLNSNSYNDVGDDFLFPAQDSTAGVILRDTNGSLGSGLINTAPAGTSFTDLEGELDIFFDLEQIIVHDVGTQGTAAAPTPQVVTISTLLADIDAFESQLVQVNSASRTDAATGNWTESTNYTFNDGTGSFDVRFADNAPGASALVGQALPAMGTPVTLQGIGTHFGGTTQLSPVDAADFTVVASDDPNISVPASASFPIADIGTPESVDVIVSNTGATNALNITTAISGTDAARFSVTAGGAQSIPAGSTGTVTVEFDAASGGTFSASLDITSDDSGGDSPVSVALSAQAGVLDVANIAAARAEADGTALRITGQIVLSTAADRFLVTSGLRIYPVQDSTGGLLIVEDEADLQTPETAGAGLVLVGARGNRIDFGRGSGSIVELELDSVDSFFGSTMINLQFPSVPGYNAGYDDYESELIGLLSVRLQSDPNGTGLWQTGTTYTFQDPSANTVAVRLRDDVTALNGTALPAVGVPTVIFGIGDEFNSVGQVAPVSVTDFFPVLSANDWDLFE